MKHHLNLAWAAAIAAMMLMGLAGGCATGRTDFATGSADSSASSSTTTAATGGNTGAGGGTGGQSLPCGIDCSMIQAPQCQLAQCNLQTLQCEIVPDVDGGACEDGMFCTAMDTCQGGLCQPGPTNDCGMTPGPCQSVTCNEMAATCSFMALANGTACTNANLCISGSTCTNSLCTGGTPTDCFFFPVPNQCHVAECDPMNGLCHAVPGNFGQACVDSTDLCTLNKTCDMMGSCQGGTPKDCSALTMGCNLGVCNTSNGNCVQMAVMNGQPCNDLNACTTGEVCTNAMCGGGMPVTVCSLTGDGCCPMNCNAMNDLDCQIPQSCNALKMSQPNIMSGVYTIDPDLSGPLPPRAVYCDMTTGITYEQLGIGNHNTTVSGWTWISATALGSTQVQQAFIYLHNTQGGLINITPNWSSGNCCVREAGSDLVMAFGGLQVRPANPMGTSLICQTMYPEPMLRFGLFNTGPAPLPLPTTYFTTNPPTAISACGDSNNPGFFFRQYL